MSIQINTDTIKKLNHGSTEIRLRTLQQIEGKICRGMSFNENVQYDSVELITYLIRWFKSKPLMEENRVLQLILLVLKGPNGCATINCLGKERLMKEIDKILYIVKRLDSQEIIAQIKAFLIYDLEPVNDVIELSDDDDDSGSVLMVDKNVNFSANNRNCAGYELPWSLPSTVDYNSLKQLCEKLDLECLTEKDKTTIKHLKFKIYDYPAEYFLQPPYIINSLLNIILNERDPLADALDSILNITLSISARLKVRSLSSMFQSRNNEIFLTQGRIQISVEKFCEDVLCVCIEYLKTSIFDYNSNIYKIIQIIYNVSAMLIQTPGSNISLRKHLIDLCFITHKIRNSSQADNYIYRSKYMILVFFIAKIAKLEKIEDENINCSVRSEMQAAIFDLPLMRLFPSQHKIIESLVGLHEKPILEEIFKIGKCIDPVVKLLRQCSKLSDEELLNFSQIAMQTLEIYDSLELIKRFHLAIINCIPLYLKDNNLKHIAQKLLLSLFANENLTIKRFVYKESANAVKKYFASLMEGNVSFQKIAIEKLSKAQIVGIPLSNELIIEIVCFGCSNEDSTINTNAELILSLILKSRTFLKTNWEYILELITPNLSLLQSLPNESNLTKIVLNFLDPDLANDIPILEIFKGNLRYLFHINSSIRSEALSRLIYMTQAYDCSNRFKPNILEISDTLPNNICCLNHERDPCQILYGNNIYEESTVINLIDILRNTDAAPDVRKTCLIQLNVICQDEQMNQFISNENGWYYAMQALESSLMVNSVCDYTECVIPCIGMISKMLLSDQSFRRELSKELTIYMLAVRGLFVFQNDITLRQDASMLIFLLAYSEFIVGNRRMTVPKIFKNLQLPINFTYHWDETPFIVRSNIEMAYASYTKEADGPCLEFIRMKFADLWFDDLNNALNLYQNTSGATIRQIYAQNSPSYLEFSNKLCLTEQDIKKIKYTSPVNNIKRCLKLISNATEHSEVIQNINNIKLFLLLKTDEKRIDNQCITEIFRKFILLPPTSEMDFLLFENCVDLFICFLDAGYDGILMWIVSILQSNQNVLTTLLKRRELDVLLYEKICVLIKKVIYQHYTRINEVEQNPKCLETKPLAFRSNSLSRRSAVAKQNALQKSQQQNHVFIEELFISTLEVAEGCCTHRKFDHLRCLLNVLLVISQKCGHIIAHQNLSSCKQLTQIAREIRCKTQIGSDILRQCLWTIGNLSQHVVKFEPMEKLQFLMTLCGHSDIEVRVLAWCALKRLSDSKNGSKKVNSDLEYFPGGAQGFCLSILLDVGEIPCVRSLAGDIFTNLICSFGNYESVVKMFNKYKLLRSIDETLNNYYPLELIDLNYPKDNITTCDIVRCYCKILITFVTMKNACDQLNETSIFLKFSDIVKHQTVLTETFIEMSAEICNLFICLNFQSSNEVLQILCQDQHFIESICKIITTKPNKSCFLPFINLLMILSNKSTWVYQMFCNYFADLTKLKDLVQILMQFIFTDNSDKILQITCISFISYLIHLSGKSTSDQLTFASILNENLYENHQQSFAQLFFTEFDKLFHQYFIVKLTNFREHPVSLQIVLCEVISVLLKSTKSSRVMAQQCNFLGKIIQVLKSFFDNFDITCTTFVRRFGDAKKLPILKNFSMLYSIILNWFYMDILLDEMQTVELSKLLIQTWPWISHSAELKVCVLKTILFLTESSIPMCKQISTHQGNSNSILVLVIKLVTTETNKIKQQCVDASILSICLRILGNCCSCQEGRSQMIKSNVLDVFDRFYPFDQKMQKYQMNTIKNWLIFWEILSRYQEGAICHHLVVITSLIQSTNKIVRLLCLKILRNMAFLQTNRTVLLTSDDYLCTINSVLASGSDEEKFIVCTTIWKLIAGNCKSKASVKNTSISKRIKTIYDDIFNNDKDYQSNDLFSVVEIILKILYD